MGIKQEKKEKISCEKKNNREGWRGGGRGGGDFRDSFFSSNIPLGRLCFLKKQRV